MRFCRFIFVAATLLGSGPVARAQAPANDNFTNRTLLVGNSVSFSGSLSNATVESNEPPIAPNGGWYSNHASVWWGWTATQSCPIVVSVSRDYSTGPALSAVLEVFSGTSLADLQRLDWTPFDVPAGRYLKFLAAAGSNYQFRASGLVAGRMDAQLTASATPIIFRQPESCTVSPYGSASFYVIAAGIPDPVFQWQLNGVDIPGEKAPTLAVHSLTNSGESYSVIVSNSGGVVISPAAIVTVTETNPVPVVFPLAPTNASQVPFVLTGEPGRWYQFELSSNMVNWNHDLPYLGYWYGKATNSSSFFAVPRLDQRKQFMKVSLNVHTDVCVAQLKTLNAAKDIAYIEMKRSPLDSYPFDWIKPYVQLQTNGDWHYCPSYGTYTASGMVTNAPRCSLSSACGHIIPPN